MTSNFSSQMAWRAIAGFLGATGVALDAVAAHALSNPLAATSVARAAQYQILHAIVLLIIANQASLPSRVARWGILLGLSLFSGSIYCKYFMGIAQASQFAPIGGSLLIGSWLALGIGALALLRQAD